MSDKDENLSLVTHVNLKDLATSLAEHAYEDGDWETLVEFVKELDRAVGDWDFTIGMHKYFKSEHKLYKEHVKEQKENAERRRANPFVFSYSTGRPEDFNVRS